MSRFELLTDTHKIAIADHEDECKYVFNKNYDYDGDELSIGTLYKAARTTDDLDPTAETIDHITGVQDVPDAVFDFLDEQGYHTDTARTSHQL